MSTAIRETVTNLHEIGLAPVDPAVSGPAAALVRRPRLRTLEASPRRLPERRPRDSRPAGPVPTHRRRVRSVISRPPRGGHPMDVRVAEAQVGFAVLAVAALLSALVVTSLILLAQWRAGSFGVQPATTPVVVEQIPVREPGAVR
ncbi:hypothetical protein ACFVMC_21700 [Nocardia sp. NPDC127579]|uniref:hypothetical protein n=1 Tax=Nocardia sp. NPDC127579 TaxID=3345402 RepID=UPI00362C35A8